LSDHVACPAVSDKCVAGEVLLSHIRSIDTQARPVRYAGTALPSAVAQLVRAKLNAFITI
jgi:mRNA interferase MazF